MTSSRVLLAWLLAAFVAAALTIAPARAQTGAPDGIGALPVLPQAGELTLAAYHAETGQPILEGLIWRVFELREGEPVLVAREEGATPRVSLPPANYMVHVSWGFASAMRQVTMLWGDVVERLVISAGGLQVRGVVGDRAIPTNDLTYAVYVPMGDDAEGRLVVAEARPSDLIRLPEGDYHVVSTYGDANASMRADLSVSAGQVTIATLNHRAARVTLKLVADEGGEAFAGTAFTVLTPGGDVVREAIGAFPSVVLAEGDYVLIARHEGRVFTREFRVESGLDRDIEVLAEG
ncbi:hypothetical protein [Salinarimonas ramus]|uniref:Uncharacterized protein n=1 Tax=Salinarimonas ramus TaxID=690164 RepID=A0A917V9Y1_9HYPH|nr:hypothetical protein [Salinarimonas ramus]GGK54272.1 hypothetical protein GCM10011322_46340 [Salinarimonas ramus]